MLSCSQQSIFSAMDRFVKAVNNVKATVLVPSKLRDMDVAGRKRSRIPPALVHTDSLYSFYLMLEEVKQDLLWGPVTGAVTAATTAAPTPHAACEQKHVRQPSDDSLPGSLAASSSTTASDPDTDSEVDSLLADRESLCVAAPAEHACSHLAAAFRHHMQGLHTILHQLADSADYLCVRYQEEVDASASP